MALKWHDRILETSTTTGTGAFTLAGAVTGFKTFASRLSTNDTCYYSIEGVDAGGTPTGEWETGLGTYSGVNTLTRTTVLESSNSDAAVNFSAGTKRVMLAVIAGGSTMVAKGTAFPSSPATGDIFYRTDLRTEAYYDGTRWLSSQAFSLDMAHDAAAQSASWNGTGVVVNPQYSGLDLYIVHVMHSITISGTGTWTCWVRDNSNNVISSKTASASSHELKAVGSVVSSAQSSFALQGTEDSGTATCVYRAAINYRHVLT